jgi:hypothetical protein
MRDEEQGRGIMADRFDLDAIDADDALLDLLAAGGDSARSAGEHDPAVKLLADLRLAVEVVDELPVETIDDPESFLARCAALSPVTDPFARKMAARGLALGVAAVAALSVSGVAAAVNGDPLSPYEKVIEKMVDAVSPQTSFPKEQLDGLPVVDKTKIVKVAKDYKEKADQKAAAEDKVVEAREPVPPAAVLPKEQPDILQRVTLPQQPTVTEIEPTDPPTTTEPTDPPTTTEPTDPPTTTEPTTTEPPATTPTDPPTTGAGNGENGTGHTGDTGSTTAPGGDTGTGDKGDTSDPGGTTTQPGDTGSNTGGTGQSGTDLPSTDLPGSDQTGTGQTGTGDDQTPAGDSHDAPAVDPLAAVAEKILKPILPTPTAAPAEVNSPEQFSGEGVQAAGKHSSGKVTSGSVREVYPTGKHSTGQYAEGKHAAIARTHGSTDDANVLKILDVVNKPTR